MSYTNNLNTHNGKIGKIGEDLAAIFLEKSGYKVLERNFRTKLGEIDMVCISSVDGKSKIHIVEVKTSMSLWVRPEENMHAGKLRKVARMAELYTKANKNKTLKKVSHETGGEDLVYSIDFVGVNLNNDGSLKDIVHLKELEI